MPDEQDVADYQAGQFQRYLWRKDQAEPFQHQAAAGNSPSEVSTSHAEEDEDGEALPTCLSGMARYLQAQREARAKQRRQPLANTDAR